MQVLARPKLTLLYVHSPSLLPQTRLTSRQEWILETIGAAPGSHSDIDWPQVWIDSEDRTAVRAHLAELKETRPKETQAASNNNDKASYHEFAASFWTQQVQVQKRVFQQYWRYVLLQMHWTVLSQACLSTSNLCAHNSRAGHPATSTVNSLWSSSLAFLSV